MKHLSHFILSLLMAISMLTGFLGIVVGFVPASLICQELGHEGVRFQLTGVLVAIVSGVVFLVCGAIRDFLDY